MKDEIIIAQALNGEVRIHAGRTTNLVEEARKVHTCMPTSIAALGRTLTATALIASDLKNDDEVITSIINGHGPCGTILAQAKGNGEVRGFVGDPNIYLVRDDGHLDVGKAVGINGTLTVTKDLGLKDQFRGVVDLQTGEIGDDFVYYFAISEQTPSMVSVGVLVGTEGNVEASGGFIYQLLPDAHEETIQALEKISQIHKPVTELIQEGLSLEEILKGYFEDVEILEHRDVRWHCGCSKEHYAISLATLKDEDLKEMIDDGSGAEIVCQYCEKKYDFTTEELISILENKHVEHR